MSRCTPYKYWLAGAGGCSEVTPRTSGLLEEGGAEVSADVKGNEGPTSLATSSSAGLVGIGDETVLAELESSGDRQKEETGKEGRKAGAASRSARQSELLTAAQRERMCVYSSACPLYYHRYCTLCGLVGPLHPKSGVCQTLVAVKGRCCSFVSLTLNKPSKPSCSSTLDTRRSTPETRGW